MEPTFFRRGGNKENPLQKKVRKKKRRTVAHENKRICAMAKGLTKLGLGVMEVGEHQKKLELEGGEARCREGGDERRRGNEQRMRDRGYREAGVGG